MWATVLLPRLSPLDGFWQDLRGLIVRSVLWVVPCAIYLRSQHGRWALRPLRLNLPPTVSHWVAALGLITATSLAVSIDVARKSQSDLASVWGRLVHELSFAFPATPLFEELVFRGVILSELVVLFGMASSQSALAVVRARFWLANLVSSLVFTGLHWPWWIYTEGIDSPEMWMKSAGVFLLSMVLGVLFVRGQSLWPCVLLHWLNNELSRLLV